MTNSHIDDLTIASTPTDMRSVGFFGDSANSGGYRVTGSELQRIFGRHSTAIHVTSVSTIGLTSTPQRIEWDTVIGSDSLGAFDANSVGTFFIPNTGYYKILTHWFDATSNNVRQKTWFQINSVTKNGCEHHSIFRGLGGRSFETMVFTANANDKIETWMTSNSSHNIFCDSVSTYCELWQIERTA
jgi:hypothetical protein